MQGAGTNITQFTSAAEFLTPRMRAPPMNTVSACGAYRMREQKISRMRLYRPIKMSLKSQYTHFSLWLDM